MLSGFVDKDPLAASEAPPVVQVIFSICKNVIDKTIIPEFKNGEYYSGIKSGLKELIELWE